LRGRVRKSQTNEEDRYWEPKKRREKKRAKGEDEGGRVMAMMGLRSKTKKGEWPEGIKGKGERKRKTTTGLDGGRE
jgi:hypothetical protein